MTAAVCFDDVPYDPHVTLLVLPGGLVHDGSALLEGPESVLDRLREGRRGAQVQAADLGRLVRVSVAHADGRVEAQVVGADGAVTVLVGHPRPSVGDGAAVSWSVGMRRWEQRLASIRAAELAGGVGEARVRAAGLAEEVTAEYGEGHPYAVLATELRAYLAMWDGDFGTAFGLYVGAADRRHRLGGPPEELERDLHNAVACWARSAGRPGEFEEGCVLGHLLARVDPRPTRRVGVVLRRLGELL